MLCARVDCRCYGSAQRIRAGPGRAQRQQLTSWQASSAADLLLLARRLCASSADLSSSSSRRPPPPFCARRRACVLCLCRPPARIQTSRRVRFCAPPTVRRARPRRGRDTPGGMPPPIMTACTTLVANHFCRASLYSESSQPSSAVERVCRARLLRTCRARLASPIRIMSRLVTVPPSSSLAAPIRLIQIGPL